MRNCLRKCLTGGIVLSAMLYAGISFAADAQNGPTPYPKDDKDWPGKGVIRKFGWMDDNRKWFWTQREKEQGAVVFVGDSLTGGWKDIGKAFPGMKVANRGIGGDVSRGVLFRFQEDVLDLSPRAIVITVGTNDLTAAGKTDDYASNIADILAMVEKKNPDLPVVLCTTPPSANPKAPVKLSERQALNAGIVKAAEGRKNVAICDLYAVMANADGTPKGEYFGEDKLHMVKAGYDKWTETIKPVFEKLGIK
ncbi:MAG TPA: hypothetical protein DET40_17135 [Lentisphaeria bacterium]|nr:MAG: hypothetical protein A2X45_02870 [Lentisphaerae bacterium GWF2_50_93]HCE45266.1 hypothetical protein [Lentisphaeria bacterium]